MSVALVARLGTAAYLSCTNVVVRGATRTAPTGNSQTKPALRRPTEGAMQRQRAGVRPSPVAAVVVVRDVRVGPCPASQPAAATCAPHWPPLAGDWRQPLPFRRHPQADDATAVQCRQHVCTSCNRFARNSSSRIATAALTARAWTASRSGSTAAVLPCIVPATGGARRPCSPRLTIRQRSNATASRCCTQRASVLPASRAPARWQASTHATKQQPPPRSLVCCAISGTTARQTALALAALHDAGHRCSNTL